MWQYVFTRDIAGMRLFIDETEIKEIAWADCASVKALRGLLPLRIHMNRYGGFEQVGSIGRKIESSDIEINTRPGDIVLYDSGSLVIFFGSNSWSYTKLGHIDLPQSELCELLDKRSVVLKLEA